MVSVTPARIWAWSDVLTRHWYDANSNIWCSRLMQEVGIRSTLDFAAPVWRCDNLIGYRIISDAEALVTALALFLSISPAFSCSRLLLIACMYRSTEWSVKLSILPCLIPMTNPRQRSFVRCQPVISRTRPCALIYISWPVWRYLIHAGGTWVTISLLLTHRKYSSLT